MSLAFEVQSVKEYLVQSVARHPTLNYSRLAEALRVQRSYLSQVLADKARLSADQLYLAAKSLGASRLEVRYLLLLSELERAQVKDRVTELERELISLKAKALRTDRVLSAHQLQAEAEAANLYYSSWINGWVHMLCLIPQNARNPKLIGERLGLNPKRLEEALLLLKSLKLIEWEKDKPISVLKTMVHLPAHSPLAQSHAAQIRMKTAEQMTKRSDPDSLHFSATFCANSATRLKIKEAFLKFLENQSKLIERAPEEEVFQLSFDLYSIDR